MDRNRRRILQSLSRTALVLPFADLLGIARPFDPQQGEPISKGPPIERSYDAKPRPSPRGPKSPIEGTPLGVSFVDVVHEAGLAVKTTFGGENKNRFLLETTGCGLAFYDYDADGWLDIFLVNGWRLEGFAKGGNRIAVSLRTIGTGRLRTLPKAPDWMSEADGDKPVV